MRQTPVSNYDLSRILSDGLKRWSSLAERNIRVVGLNLAELRVLRLLSELGPCSMVTLAKEQQMTAPGMTIVVDKLEDAGLVRRMRSDADRRIINVAITGKGGERLKRAKKLNDLFIERATHGLTSQEVNSFFTTLNKLISACEGG